MDKLKPAQTDSQRGRSAALVHGLAFLAASLALGAVWFVIPDQTKAWKILGMGLSAVAVMTLWSIILAIQALWRGESGKWPMGVLGVFTIEVAALCASLCLGVLGMPNNILFRTGLPVFVPFGMLVSLVAAPVAFWRARRAEFAEIASKMPEWRNRRRWKHRFAWYAGIFTILTVLLLPWPLFVFCAASAHYNYPRSNFPDHWRNSFARHTPDFIRNTVAFLLEQSTLNPLVALHEKIVHNGYLSQSELQRHLNGASRVLNRRALNGISMSKPDVALEFALEIADGRRTCTYPMTYDAGRIMGENGSAEQIRYCLEHANSPPAYFRLSLLNALNGDEPREQILLMLLADQNPETRYEAARLIYHISEPEMYSRLCLACLKHSDVLIRYGAIEAAMNSDDLSFRRPKIQPTFVERLVELLDEHDLVQRRGAVWLLSNIVGARADSTPAPESSLSGIKATRGGTPSPEIPGESETVETMRMAARKWLAAQKQ